MAIDEDTGEQVINTLDLSKIMEDTYNNYETLWGEGKKNE